MRVRCWCFALSEDSGVQCFSDNPQFLASLQNDRPYMEFYRCAKRKVAIRFLAISKNDLQKVYKYEKFCVSASDLYLRDTRRMGR